MDPTVLVIYLYKALVLATGFGCVCLGVWLTLRNVDATLGDIEAQAGNGRGFKLSKPTVAALLILAGAAIMIFGVARPFSYQSNGTHVNAAPADTAPAGGPTHTPP